MNLDLLLDILPILFAVGAAIWRVATVKAEIYDYIDKRIGMTNQKLRQNIYDLEKKLDNIEHLGDRERLIINGNIEKVKHTSLRLENSISDLNNYLEKTGEFRARRGLYRQDNEP
ncbi:MAG: hypothetical protein AB4372_03685 [Xenococcus sp. (in: cyanobacteria)]